MPFLLLDFSFFLFHQKIKFSQKLSKFLKLCFDLYFSIFCIIVFFIIISHLFLFVLFIIFLLFIYFIISPWLLYLITIYKLYNGNRIDFLAVQIFWYVGLLLWWIFQYHKLYSLFTLFSFSLIEVFSNYKFYKKNFWMTSLFFYSTLLSFLHNINNISIFMIIISTCLIYYLFNSK